MNKKKIIRDLDLGRFSDCIKKYKLIPNADGTFDYDGDLNFIKIHVNSLLDVPVKINLVKGNFSCQYNNLISLEGSPLEVSGDFRCGFNELVSLQYAPKIVDGHFDCHNNNLLSTKCMSIFNHNRFKIRYNPFDENSNVIKTVKRMTYQQQIKELDFLTFKKNSTKSSLKAYNVMKKILDDLGVNYGEGTREMVAHKNSLDIGYLI